MIWYDMIWYEDDVLRLSSWSSSNHNDPFRRVHACNARTHNYWRRLDRSPAGTGRPSLRTPTSRRRERRLMVPFFSDYYSHVFQVSKRCVLCKNFDIKFIKNMFPSLKKTCFQSNFIILQWHIYLFIFSNSYHKNRIIHRIAIWDRACEDEGSFESA